MKMQIAHIYNLIKVLLCLQILCVCNGAPPKKDGQPSSSTTPRYTDQEIEFIKDELQNLPNDYMRTSDKTIWQEIAEKIQELRNLGTEGFAQDRTTVAIRKFFKRHLAENEEFMANLPATLREQLSDLNMSQRRGGSQPYSYEEDKIIVDELSKLSGSRIQAHTGSVPIWIPIAEKLNRKRGLPGFYAERSPDALRHRFIKGILLNPNRRVKVPDTMIKKFHRALKKRKEDGEFSGLPASQIQQTGAQEAMIQELLTAPAVNKTQHNDEWSELDFSKLDLPESASLSDPDDLGSDLKYLQNFEDFWTFKDFK